MGMLYQVILRRVFIGVVTLFCVSAIIFAAVQMLPGDMAQQILGQSATPETLSALRHELGLDQPALTRYLHWLYGSLQGDFGTSLSNGRPVAEMIGQRMVNTLFLASYTAIIAVPLAVTLGLFAALYKDSLYDRCVNVISLAAVSLPEFFIGYILILLFSVTYSIFPSIADVPASAGFAERLHSAFLPVLTLTLVITAHMMRMTRIAVLDLLRLPYIEMARLKGLSRFNVVIRHALPNAWAPIVNVIAVNLAYLITGVVVVEVVFVYPGLGQLMVDSVVKRDFMVVQACCCIFAVVYISINLLADIISIATNPRLLHRK
ncbi:ABC transporter permease [Pseudomonas sp. 14P_8.1_Bac3]|uniref:ABC transporter permease n=1 Tax=Pseudomonas sp. 14P_8.1_Bac3 TaxID=2971621 RepID=UPI0021CA1D29|nr:ABC transporter permease [Pseudomonas sp. 14P_8.1_Bac3]MCU1763151.1 ABC transporter permease [Pseudomonas sp. 14P_8.1_Bac3]